MAALEMLGDWLTESIWTYVLVEAEVTTAGKSDQWLHSSQVKLVRYAHEMTYVALYVILMTTYSIFEMRLTFDKWIKNQARLNVQFKFAGYTVFQVELVLF